MSLLLWIGIFFGLQPSNQDTLVLDQVEVYAPSLNRFSQGQKIQTYSGHILKSYTGRTLGELLQETSPVFVRQYGAGMLASPSFRGTSAGHTAVFWNGIPINSPSLGQSDLSIIPLAGVDGVALHFGNGGALFGNEAIGGSIHLSSQPGFDNGFQMSFIQQFGSFGLFNNHLKIAFSTPDFSSVTRFYRESAKNNFTFEDLSRAGTPEVKATHSEVWQSGIVQDLAWNTTSNQQLKASIWYNQAKRQIQPLMGSSTLDVQEDQNLRLAIDYFFFRKKSILNLKTGFVRDEQLFNQIENNTSQYLLSTDWNSSLSPKLNLNAGLRLNFIVGDLSTYQATDQRIESYQSIRYQPNLKLNISLNLRQLAFQDQFEPFIPSLGADWDFWENSNHALSLKSSIAKGFKVPTLNDRYWQPGGNPDLLPEKSSSGELGLIWKKSGNLNLQNSLTYYQMQVDNWIIWLPRGNVWSPENIREVQNLGFEYHGEANRSWGSWNLKANWTYAWSRAVSTKGIGASDASVGKQLPYTPKHQANGRITVERKDFSAFIGTFYVGERRISTDSQRMVSAYQLYNLGLGYGNLTWGKLNFPIRFQINNLFNKPYQVLYLRPMPGRSFQITISINL